MRVKLPFAKIMASKQYRENLKAAMNRPGSATIKQIQKRVLKGTAAEIGAYLMLNTFEACGEIKFNDSPDYRMLVSFDLKDDLYRYEVKGIAAGDYATFHTEEGGYSINGTAGFDMSAVLRHKKADWLLVMNVASGLGLDADSLIVTPGILVWIPALDKYTLKSKRHGGGFYFDRMMKSVDDEFIAGTLDITNYFQKLCTQPANP